MRDLVQPDCLEGTTDQQKLRFRGRNTYFIKSLGTEFA